MSVVFDYNKNIKMTLNIFNKKNKIYQNVL